MRFFVLSFSAMCGYDPQLKAAGFLRKLHTIADVFAWSRNEICRRSFLPGKCDSIVHVLVMAGSLWQQLRPEPKHECNVCHCSSSVASWVDFKRQKVEISYETYRTSDPLSVPGAARFESLWECGARDKNFCAKLLIGSAIALVVSILTNSRSCPFSTGGLQTLFQLMSAKNMYNFHNTFRTKDIYWDVERAGEIVAAWQRKFVNVSFAPRCRASAEKLFSECFFTRKRCRLPVWYRACHFCPIEPSRGHRDAYCFERT